MFSYADLDVSPTITAISFITWGYSNYYGYENPSIIKFKTPTVGVPSFSVTEYATTKAFGRSDFWINGLGKEIHMSCVQEKAEFDANNAV